MEEDNNPIQETKPKKEETQETSNTQNVGAKKQNNMCLIGFIFSLAGILVAAIPCGIVAIVTSIMGMVKFDGSKEKGKGFAIAGIVIGIIDIIAGIANVVIMSSNLL